MNVIRQACDWLLAQGGWMGIALMAALLAATGVQLWYWLRVYGRIPFFRGGGRKAPDDSRREEEGIPEGVSVIVQLRDADYGFVEQTLPLIMAQSLAGFEVILMDLADDADFSFTLKELSEGNPKIKIIKLAGAPMKMMSDKMLLNVGIKGAHYENLVFTTAACRPVSEKWLAAMSGAFRRGDIVLGYCGLEAKEGHTRAWQRIERVGWSARWLGAALRGKPYRGIIGNLGFTRKAYFDNNGFNHLNMRIGEDDLFVQKLVAGGARVSVVTAGKASVRQTFWTGWYADKKLRSATYGFYPFGVRAYIAGELWSRALFFAAAIALIVMMPFEIQISAAGLFLLRFVLASRVMGRICRRLGERGLGGASLFYDLAAPIFEAWLAVARKLRKPDGLWRQGN